jgi:GNAT superfamily N-acetyltransferase
VQLEFRLISPARPPASELLEAMVVEVVGLFGETDPARAPAVVPAELGPPHGACVAGWDRTAQQFVAVGGLRRAGPRLAEVKRMYVIPGARGRGVGRQLLAALEDQARRLGYASVRLDTGPHQAGAQHLYRSSGYEPVSDFNGNPYASFWGEKRL